MPICTKCGHEIKEGAKFCTNCGEAVPAQTEQETNRKTQYDGEIHKCPNCGEAIPSFVSVCPSCGYEFRNSAAASSVQSFYRELRSATSSEQKGLMIRNYPIPNAKEDIVEFLILTSSNIDGEDDEDLFDAWVAKFEQVYEKALIILKNDAIFPRIEEIYNRTEEIIRENETMRKAAAVQRIIVRFLHMMMSNFVFSVVVILVVVFDIYIICDGNYIYDYKGALDYEGICALIFMDAMILIPAYLLTNHREADEERERSRWNPFRSMAPPEDDGDKIKIPSGIANGGSRNYVVIETMFLKAGFVNVRSVPLYDLTFGVMSKPGEVHEIIIDGKEISDCFRKKFDPNASVVITYHSLKT